MTVTYKLDQDTKKKFLGQGFWKS